jgi:hypothetical protein
MGSSMVQPSPGQGAAAAAAAARQLARASGLPPAAPCPAAPAAPEAQAHTPKVPGAQELLHDMFSPEVLPRRTCRGSPWPFSRPEHGLHYENSTAAALAAATAAAGGSPAVAAGRQGNEEQQEAMVVGPQQRQWWQQQQQQRGPPGSPMAGMARAPLPQQQDQDKEVGQAQAKGGRAQADFSFPRMTAAAAAGGPGSSAGASPGSQRLLSMEVLDLSWRHPSLPLAPAAAGLGSLKRRAALEDADQEACSGLSPAPAKLQRTAEYGLYPGYYPSSGGRAQYPGSPSPLVQGSPPPGAARQSPGQRQLAGLAAAAGASALPRPGHAPSFLSAHFSDGGSSGAGSSGAAPAAGTGGGQGQGTQGRWPSAAGTAYTYVTTARGGFVRPVARHPHPPLPLPRCSAAGSGAPLGYGGGGSSGGAAQQLRQREPSPGEEPDGRDGAGRCLYVPRRMQLVNQRTSKFSKQVRAPVRACARVAARLPRRVTPPPSACPRAAQPRAGAVPRRLHLHLHLHLGPCRPLLGGQEGGCQSACTGVGWSGVIRCPGGSGPPRPPLPVMGRRGALWAAFAGLERGSGSSWKGLRRGRHVGQAAPHAPAS